MITKEKLHDLEEKIGRVKEAIAGHERQMSVHPKHLDDSHKGRMCRNYAAREIFKRRRDEANRELVELEARLVAELAVVNPELPAPPVIPEARLTTEIADFVI